MYLVYFSEDSALQYLDGTPQRCAGAALMSHLSHHAAFSGDLLEAVQLPKRAHQRLLHIHVDALPHGTDGNGGVRVVRCRNRESLYA